MPWRVVLPTSSMSLVRMHFWTEAMRGCGEVSEPMMYGMNGTMPATVNSSDGSGDTNDAEGTTACPWDSKYSSQRLLISAVRITTSTQDNAAGPRLVPGARRRLVQVCTETSTP